MSERRCERLTLGRIRKFDVVPPWLRQVSPRISNAAPFRGLRPSDWHRRIHIVAEQVLLATKCRFALFSARLRKLKRPYTALFRFARSDTHAHYTHGSKSSPNVMLIFHETQKPQKAQVM